jgi:hypothetical protein
MKKSNIVFRLSAKLLVFCVAASLTAGSAAWAVMNSQNYQVRDDSVNIGGSEAGSASYRFDQTVGEVGSGEMASSQYILRAGYQKLGEPFLALTLPAANLDLNQPGVMNLSMSTTTNASAGATVNVKTDSETGYTLTVNADYLNVMKDSATNEAFADYTEVQDGVPESWSVGGGVYEFGFSAFGNDVSDSTWGAGSACTNPAANSLKFMGFNSTTTILVASSNLATTQNGTETFLCFAAEQKGVLAPAGSYTASITVTAIAQ